MNNIIIFENKDFGSVRVVDVNGIPMFVGSDAATLLGYQNTRDAIAKHVDEDDKATVAIHDGSQNRKVVVINESGFYSLVLSSKLPTAKTRKRWVTSEVLPSIRKTGGYMIAKADDTPETIMARALVVAKETLDRQQAQISQLHACNQLQEKELKQAAPKVEYYDTAMSGQGTYSATDIAKDLGMSAKTLNKKLHALGIQYKQNDTWYLYAEYQDKDYTRIVPNYITDRNGETVNHPSMRWTEKGRKLILTLRAKGKI